MNKVEITEKTKESDRNRVINGKERLFARLGISNKVLTQSDLPATVADPTMDLLLKDITESSEIAIKIRKEAQKEFAESDKRINKLLRQLSDIDLTDD